MSGNDRNEIIRGMLQECCEHALHAWKLILSANYYFGLFTSILIFVDPQYAPAIYQKQLFYLDIMRQAIENHGLWLQQVDQLQRMLDQEGSESNPLPGSGDGRANPAVTATQNDE